MCSQTDDPTMHDEPHWRLLGQRYRVEAWATWAPVAPIVTTFADESAARAFMASQPMPLADLIDRDAPYPVIAVRRDLAFPA